MDKITYYIPCDFSVCVYSVCAVNTLLWHLQSQRGTPDPNNNSIIGLRIP